GAGVLRRRARATTLAGVCASVVALVSACDDPRGAGDEPARLREEKLSSDWDPRSGRGQLSIDLGARGRVEVGLQERYDGYSGGLVLGSMGRSGYRWYTPGAADFTAIWCAMDESIWRHDTRQEYAYGWSKNFGRGPDGVLLRYLGGRVFESGPERIVLGSVNAAAPLRVARWLLVDASGTLLFRVRVRNEGKVDLPIDLWVGDDPWVGEYGTAAGDVGWYDDTWVTEERAVPLEPGGCLGIADVRRCAASDAGICANVANALCLSPDSPPPHTALFANGFAHDPSELLEGRALQGDSDTAFNLGWRDVSLAPGDDLEIGYALALAELRADGQTPRAPAIDPDAWRTLAALPEAVPPTRGGLAEPLRFASERVVMEVLPGGDAIELRGRYRFHNASDERIFRRIYFPFAIDEAHPFPTEVSVSSGRYERMPEGVLFPIALAARSERTVEIRYVQRALDRSATYIVTSARMWSEPLDHAELVVITPRALDLTTISYPMTTAEDGERRTHSTRIDSFFPDHELTVRW
ncbi:MAG: hypothetical protein KC486_14905, partial [Myxococcales bacterium]|nr:hypothetical protein [Myxococcales bacterium]